ncbi:hypothetical protein WA026_000018 [Henosepilachna vigintioctopunctata]|uniref:POU-specific domain-containing protein n=1 Tax=Henosepilachna vigintioctopunctata TaxID=420089 RepID=A0AAW1UW92_9CUCU
MPIFGNKFSPKKTPIRKAGNHISNDDNLEELVLENRVVSLQLGKHIMKFEDGVWIPESGKDASLHKSNKKLRKRIGELEEENNLLKLKSEILLNLLTQTTAESHLQQRELEKFKKDLKK